MTIWNGWDCKLRAPMRWECETMAEDASVIDRSRFSGEYWRTIRDLMLSGF